MSGTACRAVPPMVRRTNSAHVLPLMSSAAPFHRAVTRDDAVLGQPYAHAALLKGVQHGREDAPLVGRVQRPDGVSQGLHDRVAVALQGAHSSYAFTAVPLRYRAATVM